MIVEIIRIDCPLLNTNYKTKRLKDIAQFCMSIAGNCKVCKYAVVVKGFRARAKKSAVYVEGIKCTGCN